MNKELFLQIFKAPYKRQSFIDNVLLPTVQGKVDNLEIYDEHGAQEIELTNTEAQYAKSAVKYGEFTTRNEIGRKVELYEVILHDHKQVERSRVGIASLIKKQIIGNNAVLVNFAYANPQNRSWRFSFIAHDAVFTEGEMVQSETNPKRYTYVFGEPDETYRTALERFYTLGHEYAITVEALKEAFGVEAMSKAFFDEYRDIHYLGFVDYLTRSNFKQSVFNGNEKAIRDFVKKLLGRIVFLYFIQKKGWLGVRNGKYGDGDKNFMSNFYKESGANESFYSIWLSKLFFETLNNPRPNDAFEMPDGSTVMIPYLNGGLFEKESNKYDFLTFPSDLFTELFDFFDQYNFTIYEDSPEEHTVAVDPEMLGHIFENLLEDNKDKGAFYTPKEIVHYMTQESLIEYLHTQLPTVERKELEAFVKSKDNQLTEEHKKVIDQKLDAVKICDPAIGSGAFPMGLLQEIFGMKERIAFELGYTVWSPATVKEHIIQNSIYGVDIEQGAVDIARLRFWLSLIVDEDMPKALPNLDYKIVVGNSLVSKFEDEIIEIDWNTDDTSGGLFGQDLIAEKTKLLQAISEKQKAFFTADNKTKPKLAAEIRNLKLDILAKQLELMIETKGASQDKNSLRQASKKQIDSFIDTEGWKRTLFKVKALRNNDKSFNHFDWKLDFPEILNPHSLSNPGFDIVIGNPPYKIEYDVKLKKELEAQYNSFKRNNDLYVAFSEKGIALLRPYGNMAYITPNTFLNGDYFMELRKLFSNNRLLEIIDFKNSKVFRDPTVFVCITRLIKNHIPKYQANYVEIDESLENRIVKPIEILQDNPKGLIPNHPLVDRLLHEKEFTFDDYCYIKDVGFNYWSKGGGKDRKGNSIGKRVLYSGEQKHPRDIPYIKGRDIEKYQVTTKPTNFLRHNFETYLDPNDTFRYSPDFLERVPKIVYRQTSDRIIAALDYNQFYCDKTIHLIVLKNSTDQEDSILQYLLGLLNSKLFAFLYPQISKEDSGRTFSQVKTTYIKKLPLIQGYNSTISLTVSYLTYVTNSKEFTEAKKLVLDELSEILDALTFELYFPNEFRSKGILIENYARQLFVSFEGLGEQEKIERIKMVYDELRKKENPLRNQIKLMKIELKDLLLPILSV